MFLAMLSLICWLDIQAEVAARHFGMCEAGDLGWQYQFKNHRHIEAV